MTIGDCLIKLVDRSIVNYNWLPLISYKVGFIASVALNAYTMASKQPLTWVFPIWFEAMALMGALCIVFYNFDPAYTFAKTQLMAYSKGLGYLFPQNIKDLLLTPGASVFMIAGGRIMTSFLALDVCLRGKEFKQLKERDFVVMAASFALLAFTFWTIVNVFQTKNLYNPNLDICYK